MVTVLSSDSLLTSTANKKKIDIGMTIFIDSNHLMRSMIILALIRKPSGMSIMQFVRH